MAADHTPSTYTVTPYTVDRRDSWNRFVATSRNATFLHNRDYLDYHADRFHDTSVMVYDRDNRLVAMLPAADTDTEGVVGSHPGLTYGALLLPPRGVNAVDTLDIFTAIVSFYRQHGYHTLIYRAIPHIYHTMPSDDDIYALFRLGATLSEVNLSTTIDTLAPGRPDQNSRRGARRATAAGVRTTISDDLAGYWRVLTDCLKERHDASPVHSLDQITSLAAKFPDNIKLHIALDANNNIVAGVLLYITSTTVHAQYIATTPAGRQLGALHLLMLDIIDRYTPITRYIDFGTSNQDHGRYINPGLITQKTGYGARYVAHNIYQLTL